MLDGRSWRCFKLVGHFGSPSAIPLLLPSIIEAPLS
jgi:hypothetical protein